MIFTIVNRCLLTVINIRRILITVKRDMTREDEMRESEALRLVAESLDEEFAAIVAAYAEGDADAFDEAKRKYEDTWKAFEHLGMTIKMRGGRHFVR